MRWITPIALTILWLSLSLAGSPAYAHETSVADTNTHVVALPVDHADNCDSAVETQHTYNDGCTKHAACHTTCCHTCGPGVAVLGTPFVLPPSVLNLGQFHAVEHSLLSSRLESRDRPPKSSS